MIHDDHFFIIFPFHMSLIFHPARRLVIDAQRNAGNAGKAQSGRCRDRRKQRCLKHNMASYNMFA
ncbi:hypothetical protein KTQ42_02125|uniref:hypothetical protein n=1 Tax=Noviherbaspirillum sp. L7-7A TaxID=2850560 RepID=UPI001C2BDD90|nr:hypothetical protein [Noviherbaspirillum sp. L7-7A]MBV0878100.1 hypothetical protein [Noviherbaspirillum sp. L7-7A]